VADSPAGPESFESAWTAFGRVLAVVAAALVALAGVVAHVPVWLACLRGFAALVAVLALARIATVVVNALPRASRAGRMAVQRRERT
jgi:hypothetical protein